MSRAGIVVSCEHASNAIPSDLQGLGIDAEALTTHSCWDPGAAEIAREVASHAHVDPFLGQYSRIVADLNRSPSSSEVIPETSFGVFIPGNQNLSRDERRQRIERFHSPYQNAVRRAVQDLLDDDRVALHCSVHSFTPDYDGTPRDVEIGVLFDPKHPLEARLAECAIEVYRAAGIDARPNEPYEGVADALVTMLRTRLPRDRFAGIEIELSQSVLADPADVLRVTHACRDAVTAMLGRLEQI